MIAVVAVVVVAFEIVLRFTAAGRGLRAMQQDREGLALLGFNVKARTTMVFALSGLFAALAGFLITPVSSSSPQVGAQLVVPAFAALAIGGFGSFRGAIGGGLVIGLIVGIVPIYLPVAAVNPILLILIVAVLLVRPSGLFGTRAAREL
jgi:branched-chain amino acid transport system permease protein